MLRTHTCGELRLTHSQQQVTLCGWVQTIRDKGNLLWIDLRDRYGLTQLVLQQGTTSQQLFHQGKKLSREDVICVAGEVVPRKAPNPDLATGAIEVAPTFLQLLTQQL